MQILCLSEEPRSHTRDQSTSLNRFPLTLEDNFIKCILQSPKTRSCKAPLSLERSFVLPPALTRPATLSWHAQVHLPPLCIAANSFQVGSTCQRLQHCTRCILFPCFATQNTAVRLLLRIHLTWMPQSQTETQQLCSKVPWPPWGRVAWTGPCPPQGSPRLGAFPGPLGGGLGLVGMSGGRHEGTPGAWLPLELQGDNAAKSHGKWLQELDPTGSQPCRGSLD